MKKNFSSVIKQNLIWFIIFIGLILRVYNIDKTLAFFGDQARDAIIVSNIFRKFDPVFIGPVTSVGNMYLGPLYYYMMMPFLLISYPSPIGPAFLVVLLNIILIFLFYKLLPKKNNLNIIASFLLAINCISITYSRFSWNPNPAPLFSFLIIYSIYKSQKNPKFWLYTLLFFSIIIQMHYITLIIAPFIGIAILRQYILKKQDRKQIIKYVSLGILIFILSLTPLVAFDIKHNFINTKAFFNIFTKENSFYNTRTKLPIFIFLPTRFASLLNITIFKFLFKTSININILKALSVLPLFIFIKRIIFYKKSKKSISFIDLNFIFFIFSIFGISFYQHNIYDHYLLFLLPSIIILFAFLISLIRNKKIFYIGLPIFIFYTKANLPCDALKPLSYTYKDMFNTSKFIIKNIKPKEKYIIVSFSYTKDDYGLYYRYFLDALGHPPAETGDYNNLNKVVIINEEHLPLEKILSSPKYEIAMLKQKNIIFRYNIKDGPEIIILKVQNEK